MKKKEHDFHKDWEVIKKQLTQVGQEAVKIAKQGEKEIVRISQEGKRLFDSTTLEVKREKIIYHIGQEYIKAKCPAQPTAKMQKLLEELKTVGKQQRQLKTKKKAKKAAKRK